MKTPISILIVSLLLAGCLHGSPPQEESGSTVEPSQPAIVVQTSAPPTKTPLPTTVSPTTTPPATAPSPATTSPPTREQKITADLIGRSLAISTDRSYTVRAQDIKKIEPEVLDGMPVWKVTVVGPVPYAWFVYYTAEGTLYRSHKQFG